MELNVARRERLNRFVDLARIYRGWTRHELASRLGRDLSKVVPESGNPKLDLVVALAEALDWNVGDVARCVWEQPPQARCEGEGLEAIERLAEEAERAHDWRGLVSLERGLLATVRTPAERGRALERLAAGHRGLGRHARAIECLREALSVAPADGDAALAMQVQLAGSHYALWNVLEARAMAHAVIERFGPAIPDGRVARMALARSLAIRGHCARRSIRAGERAGRDGRDAGAAAEDLGRATAMLDAIARDLGDEGCAGEAHGCRGAMLEVECARGTLDPDDAIGAIIGSLDLVEDPGAMPPGPWLEACGWWCVYGCNVAGRHLPARRQQRTMAILTNKALEIADRLDDWSLRERAFALEQSRRSRFAGPAGVDEPWLLDDEDLRTVVGTMGRFPSFREDGWRILASARSLAEQ